MDFIRKSLHLVGRHSIIFFIFHYESLYEERVFHFKLNLMDETKGSLPSAVRVLLFSQRMPDPSQTYCLACILQQSVISLNLEIKTVLRDSGHSVEMITSQVVPEWAQVRPPSPRPPCLRVPPRPYGSLALTPHLSGEFGNWVYVRTKYNFPALSLDLELLGPTKAYLFARI